MEKDFVFKYFASTHYPKSIYEKQINLIFVFFFLYPRSINQHNQDKWKYNCPMNTNAMSAIGGGISMQSSQQSQQQGPPNTIVKPPSLPQMLNPSLQQDRTRHSVNINDQPQLLQHQISNHLNVGPTMNHSGLSNNSGMPNMQMPPTMQNVSGIYDHMHPNGKILWIFVIFIRSCFCVMYPAMYINHIV